MSNNDMDMDMDMDMDKDMNIDIDMDMYMDNDMTVYISQGHPIHLFPLSPSLSISFERTRRLQRQR